MKSSCRLAVLVALLIGQSCGASPTPPGLELQVYVGDLSQQNFVTLFGKPAAVKGNDDALSISYQLCDKEGKTWPIDFAASMRRETKGRVSWRYRVSNARNNATICSVTFPIVKDVLLGRTWNQNCLIWPSKYVGARIDNLGSAKAFEQACRDACKGVPHLHGKYQGDLCLPFFVQTGPKATFSIMVCDPTHEVIALDGFRRGHGMEYRVTTYPRVSNGTNWEFGDIKVITLNKRDWHAIADLYRDWLVSQGFRPAARHGDVAALMYGRWGELNTREAVDWAKALGIRDVCLWVVLYGRGDQYYPCYFPPPDLGIAGMKAKLDELRKHGLSPYFYTDYYLISPLQTETDAREWTKRFPKRYPARLAKNDHGYAEAVAAFRKKFDFAGEWLQAPGGIRPLRVRRLDFRWGEYALYFWHHRPFWAACVATPQWQKLFRDVTRLHTELGAKGIYLDQPAAMQPEICTARGHGHDNDTFGFWNRAFLRLLRQIRNQGERACPDFFMEAEGAADLYAKYIDRYLCNFNMPAPESTVWPRLLRYTIPWARFDLGVCGYDDGERMKRLVEKTLLLGCIFRARGGKATGPYDPKDPRLHSKAAKLLKTGIETRRLLAPYIDGGHFMDDVGLKATGCSNATWFKSKRGLLIAVQAEHAGARATLKTDTRALDLSAASALDWRTGKKRSARIICRKDTISLAGLTRGLNLIVIPSISAAHPSAP